MYSRFDDGAFLEQGSHTDIREFGIVYDNDVLNRPHIGKSCFPADDKGGCFAFGDKLCVAGVSEEGYLSLCRTLNACDSADRDISVTDQIPLDRGSDILSVIII